MIVIDRNAEIEVDRLAADPEDLDRKHIETLAERARAGVPLPPIRLNSQTEIVQGWHRLAAARLAGLPAVPAVIVEYESAEEQEADTLEENLFRRKYAPAEERKHLARLVKLRTAIREQERKRAQEDDTPSPTTVGNAVSRKPGGAKKTAKGKAIEDVAKSTGRSERTVERAARDPGPPSNEQEKQEAPAPPPCLDWFDLEPITAVDDAARAVQALIDQADTQLKALKRTLSAIRAAGHPNAQCQQLEQAHRDYGYLVRRERPIAACHFCKARDLEKCNACQGAGYATEAQADQAISAEFKARGEKAVMLDGRGGVKKVPR